MKNWFITGVSRGLGKSLALELLAQGHRVVGTTRSGTTDFSHPNLHVIKLDVTHAQQAKLVLEETVNVLGKIDVVVNNAGFGLIGAVEEVSMDEARHLFETNFFGALHVIQAALPFLRAQKEGKIVNVSSIAGFTGSPGSGLYNASKFALEGLSEALSLELKLLGIQVIIVEPGAFRTEFLTDRSLMQAKNKMAAYDASAGQTRLSIPQRNGQQSGDPDRAAKAIIQVVSMENPPLRLALGSDCVDRMRTKLVSVEKELSQFESISRNTAYNKP